MKTASHILAGALIALGLLAITMTSLEGETLVMGALFSLGCFLAGGKVLKLAEEEEPADLRYQYEIQDKMFSADEYRRNKR